MNRTEKYRDLREEIRNESMDLLDQMETMGDSLKGFVENEFNRKVNSEIKQIFEDMMGNPLERLKNL